MNRWTLPDEQNAPKDFEPYPASTPDWAGCAADCPGDGDDSSGASNGRNTGVPPASGRNLRSMPDLGTREPPLTTILEGLLFVGDPTSPALSAERLATILGLVSAAEVGRLVDELNARYEREGRPYRIFARPEGFVLQLTEEYRPIARRLRGRVKESRLSQAALEVLAIVAYRQPIASEEVSRLRGRPSGHILMQLVQKGLLQASPEPGRTRPLLFRTTRLFEEVFGLEGIDDLPRVIREPSSPGKCDQPPPDSSPRSPGTP